MNWIGTKRLAFVPVFRPRQDAVPPDWAEQIQRRIFWDPDTKGRDRSLRAHIHTTSYGRADLDGSVLPAVSINRIDVSVDALEAEFGPSLREQGFDAAALVMLGGVGAGTAQIAGFWVRFVMAEGVGIWTMEFVHALTGYHDLYIHPGHPGTFDNMAGATGTHPCAFTKLSLGWLDQAAIALHSRRAAGYDLHTLALVQPPPFGRCAAVQIGSTDPFLMVEAREMVDAFDAGIPSQGVIVYEVVSSDLDPSSRVTKPKIELRTQTALKPGSAFRSSSGVTVSVIGAIPGGYLVKVDDPTFAPEPGQLLFYRDHTRDGTGDVSSPSVIGLGGWQVFRHLFSGGDGIIYAVDADGRLLFYRDRNRDGTGDVSSPSVIGLGGWQVFRHLFSGGDGIIYAVVADT